MRSGHGQEWYELFAAGVKGGMRTMTQAYKVIIEHDTQRGYVATFPGLLGHQAQAESLKTLMERIREALAHQPELGEPAATPQPATAKREPGIAEGDR
jgi:hypothetical protein